jgi:hypothetical protein
LLLNEISNAYEFVTQSEKEKKKHEQKREREGEREKEKEPKSLRFCKDANACMLYI